MGLVNFYKCDECDNVMLEMASPDSTCQNVNMKLLEANTVDAAVEKHVPVVSLENGTVVIRVGEQPHPMVPEHYIEWVFIKTTFGGVYCDLNPGDPPEVAIKFAPEEVASVYAYCNIHGLWKAKEPVLPNTFETNDVACSAEFSAGCVTPLREKGAQMKGEQL